MQSPNALSPIISTFSPIETEVKASQPRNALGPIDVTLLGMVIELSLLISEHKYAGISSTLLPNVNEVIFDLAE